MTGARDRDRGFVAGDDRLQQRLAVRLAVIGGDEHGRHRRSSPDAPNPAGSRRRARCHAPRCRRGTRHRADRRDGRGPAPECGRAPRTRGNNLLGARCHVALRARDHHADGVEQMAPGIVPNLVRQRSQAKIGDETDQRIARAAPGAAATLRPATSRSPPLRSHTNLTSASTAITPFGRTIRGLISASATPSSSRRAVTTRRSSCASASRSPRGRPR